MGFLDFLGGSKGKLKAPAADRLFAMTTAQITLETGLGLMHRRRAGIVFQPVATADFQGILAETEELLTARPRTPARSSSRARTSSATAG